MVSLVEGYLRLELCIALYIHKSSSTIVGSGIDGYMDGHYEEADLRILRGKVMAHPVFMLHTYVCITMS